MTEPTPDYAVMAALKRYFGECAMLRMEPQWHRVQDIVATHEYRLTATERPADGVTISREDLRTGIAKAWRWLHCSACGRKHADDRPENVQLVVNEFMNAILGPDAALSAGYGPDEETGE